MRLLLALLAVAYVTADDPEDYEFKHDKSINYGYHGQKDYHAKRTTSAIKVPVGNYEVVRNYDFHGKGKHHSGKRVYYGNSYVCEQDSHKGDLTCKGEEKNDDGTVNEVQFECTFNPGYGKGKGGYGKHKAGGYGGNKGFGSGFGGFGLYGRPGGYGGSGGYGGPGGYGYGGRGYGYGGGHGGYGGYGGYNRLSGYPEIPDGGVPTGIEKEKDGEDKMKDGDGGFTGDGAGAVAPGSETPSGGDDDYYWRRRKRSAGGYAKKSYYEESYGNDYGRPSGYGNNYRQYGYGSYGNRGYGDYGRRGYGGYGGYKQGGYGGHHGKGKHDGYRDSHACWNKDTHKTVTCHKIYGYAWKCTERGTRTYGQYVVETQPNYYGYGPQAGQGHAGRGGAGGYGGYGSYDNYNRGYGGYNRGYGGYSRGYGRRSYGSYGRSSGYGYGGRRSYKTYRSYSSDYSNKGY